MLNGKPPEPDAGYARALAAQQQAFEVDSIARATIHCVDMMDKTKPYYTEEAGPRARRLAFKVVGGKGWRLGDLPPKDYKPKK